jgi:hypothetical protein
MKSKAALRKQSIGYEKVQSLLAMRESLDALKRRYDLLESCVKATEREIIDLLESGTEVSCRYELQIRSIERRYPHWKELCALLAAKVPDTPTTTAVLAIKQRLLR